MVKCTIQPALRGVLGYLDGRYNGTKAELLEFVQEAHQVPDEISTVAELDEQLRLAACEGWLMVELDGDTIILELTQAWVHPGMKPPEVPLREWLGRGLVPMPPPEGYVSKSPPAQCIIRLNDVLTYRVLRWLAERGGVIKKHDPREVQRVLGERDARATNLLHQMEAEGLLGRHGHQIHRVMWIMAEGIRKGGELEDRVVAGSLLIPAANINSQARPSGVGGTVPQAARRVRARFRALRNRLPRCPRGAGGAGAGSRRAGAGLAGSTR